MKFLLLLLSASLSYVAYNQTFNWSGYPAGGTTYTTGIMKATITSSAAGSTNGTPKYYSGSTVGSGQCGITGGLALEQMFGNATSAHITLTLDFTSNSTTNGTCSSVSFQIKDINADESTATFRDFVHISAVDGNNANVAVASITATGGSNKAITTSGGTTRIIAGSTGSYGSRSTTSCDNVTITVTPPAGVPLKRIVIRYQPSYEPCSATTGYWNFSGPYRPAYEYISIGNVTLTPTGGCIVLPVELISFNGECKEDNSKQFTWATASEVNNDYFTVESSEDGFHFKPVETIEGAGNNVGILNYSTNIENAREEYFRLVQTDFDGKKSFSDVLYIACLNLNNVLSVYPNPFEDYLHFNLSPGREIISHIQISDLNGRIVAQEYLSIISKSESITINVKHLNGGIYFAEAIGENGESRSEKIRIVKF